MILKDEAGTQGDTLFRDRLKHTVRPLTCSVVVGALTLRQA